MPTGKWYAYLWLQSTIVFILNCAYNLEVAYLYGPKMSLETAIHD